MICAPALFPRMSKVLFLKIVMLWCKAIQTLVLPHLGNKDFSSQFPSECIYSDTSHCSVMGQACWWKTVRTLTKLISYSPITQHYSLCHQERYKTSSVKCGDYYRARLWFFVFLLLPSAFSHTQETWFLLLLSYGTLGSRLLGKFNMFAFGIVLLPKCGCRERNKAERDDV